MNGDASDDRRMKELWQGQQVEGVHVSAEQIRTEAAKFQRKIGWRNVREYAAAAVVAVFFGFQFSRTSDLLTRIGFALVIAGVCYVVWRLHSKGSSRALPEDAGRENAVEFQRRELERQRDLLASVWRWYLGPVVPGIAVLIAAFARTNPGHLRHFEVVVAVYALLMAALFAFVGRLNTVAARKLQRRIDELKDLSR